MYEYPVKGFTVVIYLPPSRRRGFTLIELLVVIAIIAILAAILFPVFSLARQRARQQTCLANLKQLSLAFQSYTFDNNGGTPFIWPKDGSGFVAGRRDWCGLVKDGGFEEVLPEQGTLYPYTKEKRIYFCPVDTKRTATGFPCKPEKKKLIALSYSMNGSLGNCCKLDSTPGGSRSSQVLLFIHEDRNTLNDGLFAYAANYDLPDEVHYDGTTVSYCDGHAAWKSKKKLITEMNSNVWDINQ